jgi:hypothetical protein
MPPFKVFWLSGSISAILWVGGMLAWRYFTQGIITGADLLAAFVGGVFFYFVSLLIKWWLYSYLARSTKRDPQNKR